MPYEGDPRERVRQAWQSARDRMDPKDLQEIQALLEKAHEEASAGPDGSKGKRTAPGEMALVLSAIREELKDPGHDIDAPYVLPDGTIMGVDPYEQLDPGWLDAVVDWLHHPRETYVPFRYGATPQEIPSDLVVGLLGDWGTGDFEHGQAGAVSQALRNQHPDVSIHLGDVYYSGTKVREREHLADTLPKGRHGSFALNSNHEMYVGGEGYFHAVLDEAPAFERQAGKSYFALENDNWVIVGLDSAYFASYVEMSMTGVLCDEQIDFLAQRAATGRNLVILTHHAGLDQSDGSPLEPFFSQVTAHLDPSRTNLWYSGHNHAGYVSRRTGPVDCRCVGHGALPWGPAPELASNPTIEWLEEGRAEPWPRLLNGFAVLRFRGAELIEEILDSRGRVRWSRRHPG